MSVKELLNENNSFLIELVVFILGGLTYGCMEMLFRGHTHWSMVVTGGACVLTFYLLYGWLTTIPLVLAALAGAAIITAYEFAVGMIVNVQLGWQVWDYSQIPGNILGQICPLFTGAWFVVCFLFFAAVRIMSGGSG